MKLTKEQTNAILAGLRLVHHDRLTMADSIYAILTDGLPGNSEGLTDEGIDQLCERINFGDFDSPEADPAGDPPNGWEVVRKHMHENELEDCADPVCSIADFDFIWTVYKRIQSPGLPDGVREWHSDHRTEQAARTAARAYAGDPAGEAGERSNYDRLAGLLQSVVEERLSILRTDDEAERDYILTSDIADQIAHFESIEKEIKKLLSAKA